MNVPYSMPDISKYYREERDMVREQEARQKAAYRVELEKQMVENNNKKQREEEYRKKYEIQMLKNYPPFGRRTDFSLNNETMSNASNTVASLKDFDVKPQNMRYSPLGKESNQPSNSRETESRLSRDTGVYDKPVFGTTTGMEPYFPFGKPGNGAPNVDNTGSRQTRFVGNMWYHVNGKTPDDRKEHLKQVQATRNPLKELNKPDSGMMSTSLNDEKWILERKKAFLDKLDNINTDKYKMQDYKIKKPLSDNYETVRGNAAWFNDTFGRPGNGAPINDTKRHNLDEALESPREYKPISFFNRNNSNNVTYLAPKPQPNIVYAKVKPNISSSHRNSYDYVPKDKSQNMLN